MLLRIIKNYEYMNNRFIVPTYEELWKKLLKEFPEHYNDFLKNEELIKMCLKLLNANSDFYNYLVEKNYENYDLPTVVFEEIAYYAQYCLTKNKIDEIREILQYLENLVLEWDDEVINTISVWFLEFLANHHKAFYLKIIELMPKHLKALFMKWYWYYL